MVRGGEGREGAALHAQGKGKLTSEPIQGKMQGRKPQTFEPPISLSFLHET